MVKRTWHTVKSTWYVVHGKRRADWLGVHGQRVVHHIDVVGLDDRPVVIADPGNVVLGGECFSATTISCGDARNNRRVDLCDRVD